MATVSIVKLQIMPKLNNAIYGVSLLFSVKTNN